MQLGAAPDDPALPDGAGARGERRLHAPTLQQPGAGRAPAGEARRACCCAALCCSRGGLAVPRHVPPAATPPWALVPACRQPAAVWPPTPDRCCPALQTHQQLQASFAAATGSGLANGQPAHASSSQPPLGATAAAAAGAQADVPAAMRESWTSACSASAPGSSAATSPDAMARQLARASAADAEHPGTPSPQPAASPGPGSAADGLQRSNSSVRRSRDMFEALASGAVSDKVSGRRERGCVPPTAGPPGPLAARACAARVEGAAATDDAGAWRRPQLSWRHAPRVGSWLQVGAFFAGLTRGGPPASLWQSLPSPRGTHNPEPREAAAGCMDGDDGSIIAAAVQQRVGMDHLQLPQAPCAPPMPPTVGAAARSSGRRLAASPAALPGWLPAVAGTAA